MHMYTAHTCTAICVCVCYSVFTVHKYSTVVVHCIFQQINCVTGFFSSSNV